MLPKAQESIYIQSFKHDGSLHRTWAKGYVMEANDSRIVCVTNKTWVTESDGRRWITREPAIYFFYPDKWFNIICMIRKTGIHYYCNIASPIIIEDDVIKYIDYDLDLVKTIKGELKILDEDEYMVNKEKYGYGEEIENILQSELESLKEYAKNGDLVFNDKIINDGFNTFWNAFMRKDYDNN